ncbi:hypothetical protein PX699_18985 [Sphingobium sp. H39-3-25]|uniref:hypothetical protein n=1 Tax=Sphingobium arseniciresistens TaxID=3030834 RepID=UPI0023BA1872|nr:hypothetical protein [Sphingobium arseniciresistens]
MHFSATVNDGQDEQRSLAGIAGTLSALASGLDARFVSAGTALGTAYDIVERLVASLEGVTNALNRDAAASAVENMRSTADRLTQLPMQQAERRQSLDTIRSASSTLYKHLQQIRRTLDFLQICGLNIKVTAAGAEGFAEFADNVFGKLQLAEKQVEEFEAEIRQLTGGIAHMAEADSSLAAECAAVIPRVPQKLAADAVALQEHQGAIADLATQIADVARDIRGKVAVALGALQIGDITRQRLEHVCEGIAMMTEFLNENGGVDVATAKIVEDHMLALLAAQAADTAEDFLKEARRLTDSLHGIVPDASRLISLKDSNGTKGDEGQNFLLMLEQDIAEIESVTGRLRDAEAYSARLGSATSEAADSLAERLKAVRKLQRDVEQMSWNTALRCRSLGSEGLGLAVVASEIRGFSNTLASVWSMVSETFESIDAAAAAIRAQQDAGSGPDAGITLAQSLEDIRAGSVRMAESLTGVDQEASQVADILRDTTGNVDCEADVGGPLMDVVDMLATLAGSANTPVAADTLNETAAAHLETLLGQFARRYTMAREREVHRRFAISADGAGPEAEIMAEEPTQGMDDDDLFDDALF